MTEQITIKIGANATQAMAEMGRVKKSALGLRDSFMGFRAGLGIAGGFIGVNIIQSITAPIMAGFKEASGASAEFGAVLKIVTDGLTEFGRAIGSVLVPVVAELGNVVAKIVGWFGGSAAELAFRASFAEMKAGPQLLTGSQYTSPASDQFAERTIKNAEKQTAYLASVNETLASIERDLTMAEMFDPW
jgi:hypothetical protein